MPQLWGGQGVLGALLSPTPTEAEQGSKGAVRAALHKQHPGVQHRGHPVPGGVTQVRCHLAFGNYRFSQVQRGSAEDLSLVSFHMEEGKYVSLCCLAVPLAVVRTAAFPSPS